MRLFPFCLGRPLITSQALTPARLLVGVLALASLVPLWGMEDRTWTLMRNTLLLAGATCAISVPLGSVLAWLLVRTDLPGRRAGWVLLVVMLFVPLYLQAAAWQAGFGILGWHTLIFSAPPLLEGWTGAIWVHTTAALPWGVLIAGAGFWLVEPELEEQALLDGTPAQVFARVTLPAASTAVAVAAIWVMILTAGEMTVTDLFAVRTYAEEIYTQTAVPGDAPLGVMPGVILTAWLVAGGLALVARLASRDRPITARRRLVFSLGSCRGLIAVVVAVLLLLLVGVPLGNLCYKAGVVVTQTDTGWLRSWSPGKCLAVVATSPVRYQREFGWSLTIGVLAATAAVAAGTALAWIALGSRFRTAAVLVTTAICLAMPGPVIGVAVIWLLNRPELPPLFWLYDQSILAPWLALVVRSLPPAVLIMWHALRSVPAEMLDAAAVDGAGPVGRLWWIALASRLPAVALAWLVALAVALGDLAASILVIPPGLETLPRRIFGLLHYGVEDQVAGISIALVGLFALVAAVSVWLARLGQTAMCRSRTDWKCESMERRV